LERIESHLNLRILCKESGFVVCISIALGVVTDGITTGAASLVATGVELKFPQSEGVLVEAELYQSPTIGRVTSSGSTLHQV